MDKRGFQLSLSEWWTVSDQHYNADGEITDNVAEYGYYASILDAKYALSDRFAATLYFPFANYVYTKLPLAGSKESNWKSGDAEVGLTYALILDSSINVLSSVIIGLPFSGMVGSQATGDQSSYQQVSIAMIRRLPFFNREGWWQIGAVYRNRTNDFHDEIYFSIGLGLQIDKDFTASLALKGLKPTGKAIDAIGVFSESLFSNRREAYYLSPEIQFRINNALSIGVGIDAMLSGKNRFSDTGYQVSLIFKK